MRKIRGLSVGWDDGSDWKEQYQCSYLCVRCTVSRDESYSNERSHCDWQILACSDGRLFPCIRMAYLYRDSVRPGNIYGEHSPALDAQLPRFMQISCFNWPELTPLGSVEILSMAWLCCDGDYGNLCHLHAGKISRGRRRRRIVILLSCKTPKYGGIKEFLNWWPARA